MNNHEWVSLLEFAIKEGISPSTVRRQIKTGKIAFKLDNGKYFIQATPPATPEQASINSSSQLAEILKFAEDSLKTVKEAQRAILKQKEEDIAKLKSENIRLKQEVQELKMLIEILEKRT